MPTRDTMNIEWLRGPLAEPMTSLLPTRSSSLAAPMLATHLFVIPEGNPLLSSLRTATRFSLRTLCAALTLLALVPSVPAQISLTTAVDLALRSNPRVKGAEADVAKSRAQLSEAHDAYIPAVNAGSGLGQSYGYSPNPPTLFTVSGGSLVYNSSQISYIRSARAGINAAELALLDMQESVAEDTALAFITLDHDQQRESVVSQQAGFADTLVSIVQSRADAGQDAPIDLTQAKLTAAQLCLAALRAQDDTAVDRDHLARLIGLPATALTANSDFPEPPASLSQSVDTPAGATVVGYLNPAVAAAFATAEAKRQQARGDAHFRFSPQVNLVAQYNRYATFSDSFAQLQKVYQANGGQTTLKADQGVFGVQINLPIFDRSRQAKARESAADAARALHDAQSVQITALDGQSRLRHTVRELHSQAEIAALQQQLAQQQLEVLQQQLLAGNPNGPQMTPKDEQNARISERDKFLNVIDANFHLRQAEIQLLRQTGDLIPWLKSAAAHTPAAPTPQP